jgi:hypothetical protein
MRQRPRSQASRTEARGAIGVVGADADVKRARAGDAAVEIAARVVVGAAMFPVDVAVVVVERDVCRVVDDPFSETVGRRRAASRDPLEGARRRAAVADDGVAVIARFAVGSTMPSPQLVPAAWHRALQPSHAVALPSSHCSPVDDAVAAVRDPAARTTGVGALSSLPADVHCSHCETTTPSSQVAAPGAQSDTTAAPPVSRVPDVHEFAADSAAVRT